jgi:prepilin-type N-terminal cleavage/methylation domain-containing protein
MAYTPLKRRLSRGFTLIELLIVVIILAILAAIAIPQFSSSTSDAQIAALDANLATVRSALEQYKAQHKNTYPGANAAGTVTCTVGTNVTAAVGTKEAMEAQLRYYTDASGNVCSAPNDTVKYGPYLRQGLPGEPINSKADTVVTTTGAPLVPAAATGGWAYDTKSGQFVMNSNDKDANKKVYSDH